MVGFFFPSLPLGTTAGAIEGRGGFDFVLCVVPEGVVVVEVVEVVIVVVVVVELGEVGVESLGAGGER